MVGRSPAPDGRIAYLDGWRVAALALVLLDHVGMNRQIGRFYAEHGLGVLGEYGEVGVFVFFFISGHVVSLTSLREAAGSGDFSPAAFYVRRLFRIAPPLMLYLGGCAILGVIGAIDFSAGDFVAASLYLCNSTTVLAQCGWYAGHTWSLAFEQQFYLLFPLVFAFVELGRAPRPTLMAIAALAVAVPFAFTIWWIGTIGCLVAYGLFFAGYATARMGARWQKLFGRRGDAALIAATLVVFLPRSAVAALGADEATRAELIAWYRLLHIVAVPVMVTLSGRAGTRLERLLSARPMTALGAATYSIYLWQQLPNGPDFVDIDAGSLLLGLLCVVAACLLLFESVERPTIALGRRLSKRMSSQDQDAHIDIRCEPR